MRIADAHNDLALELAWRSDETEPFRTHWLEPLRAGSVGLQLCAVNTDVARAADGALRQALGLVREIHRAARECPEESILVRTRADLDEAERSGRIGLVVALEGTEPLGGDPGLLDVFVELGVRSVGLTWQLRNLVADGAGEPGGGGGLSRAGHALVRAVAAHGILLDLAHASDRTFANCLDHDARIVVTHTACRAIIDTPRNITDDQMKAVAERGGVIGIMAVPLMLTTGDLAIDRMVDHISHAAEVAGWRHVCLGGDFVCQILAAGAVRIPPSVLATFPDHLPVDAALDGLAGPEGYPALVAALRARGIDGEELEAILWGNLTRVLRESLPA